ncbi:MAG: hypothetical protein H7257_13150 [Taibaiella sp.]|nr:hypothetical protein [Taibaiella sp.]
MQVEESGITLNFPDNNYFRFQDCNGYLQIQSNFREMDACWYDQHNDTLYLIELKDWGDGILNEERDAKFSAEYVEKLKNDITNARIRVLFEKSLDSMIISVLLNKPYSVNIQRCIPFNISNSTTIKLLSIINWTDSDLTYLSSVQSAYKSHFRPYATLFGIRSFVVMTKTQAINLFAWIA